MIDIKQETPRLNEKLNQTASSQKAWLAGNAAYWAARQRRFPIKAALLWATYVARQQSDSTTSQKPSFPERVKVFVKKPFRNRNKSERAPKDSPEWLNYALRILIGGFAGLTAGWILTFILNKFLNDVHDDSLAVFWTVLIYIASIVIGLCAGWWSADRSFNEKLETDNHTQAHPIHQPA